MEFSPANVLVLMVGTGFHIPMLVHNDMLFDKPVQPVVALIEHHVQPMLHYRVVGNALVTPDGT